VERLGDIRRSPDPMLTELLDYEKRYRERCFQQDRHKSARFE
jgi:hypothetical protein